LPTSVPALMESPNSKRGTKGGLPACMVPNYSEQLHPRPWAQPGKMEGSEPSSSPAPSVRLNGKSAVHPGRCPAVVVTFFL
jgi:hypothetical protein